MYKTEENFKFKYHKNYDITEIKNKILEIEEKWTEDTSRQELFQVHKETTTVFLADYPLEWELNSGYVGTVREPDSLLWKLVEPIVKDLEIIHNGKAGRVIFPKLPANKNIPAHTDGGDYLDVVRRHHIPIITNNNVFFRTGDETLNMAEGECWEINNMKNHEVNNKSNQDRVHLLIDIIPNQYIGKK
jgi:hypothetical protein